MASQRAKADVSAAVLAAVEALRGKVFATEKLVLFVGKSLEEHAENLELQLAASSLLAVRSSVNFVVEAVALHV